MTAEIWLPEPEEHDFPAAQDYLELLMDQQQAAAKVAALRATPTVVKKAKDILRASQLPLLPQDNHHVAHNLAKVKKGTRLSPLLLLRGTPMVIADGYHRACAIYYLSEDLEIPCRLA